MVSSKLRKQIVRHVSCCIRLDSIVKKLVIGLEVIAMYSGGRNVGRLRKAGNLSNRSIEYVDGLSWTGLSSLVSPFGETN